MDTSRQQYPALLRSLQPGQAVAVLDERVRLVNKINNEVADWLSERRRVEEAYAQGLKRLASHSPRDIYDQLGVFRTPWQTIVSSVESLAVSHSKLASQIETDVERPLREYQNKNREMIAMNSIQGNLSSIAKELDGAHKKASKLNVGRSNANKVANANSDVEAANQIWNTQAPYNFEQLQALDEDRVNHLRQVLTQLETHEVDQVERNRITAESCLNAILIIDTSDEISTFVARNSTGAPSSAPSSRQDSRGGLSSLSAAPSAATELPSLGPTLSRSSASMPDDGPSERPNPFAPSPRSAIRSPPTQEKKSGFGGLRRLGTVLSRPGKGPKGMERMDRQSSPEKRSRPTRNPLRRGPSSTQNMQTIPSPHTSQTNLPPSPPQIDASHFTAATNESTERPETHTEERRQNKQVNGDNDHQISKRMSSVPETNGVQINRDPVSLQDPQAATTTSSATGALTTQRDAEGYSIPPSAVDDISRAQQEAAAASETEQGILKLDIRREPISEDPDAQSAFSSVANTLRAQAQQVQPTRKFNSNRGRRDVRNTIFVPSGQSLESAGLGSLAGLGAVGTSSGPAPPQFNLTNSPIPTSEPNRGAETQSIRSAHSMSTIGHPTITHPQMTPQGLNASIVETVSATFEQGQVTKAVLVGELALQHNASEGTLSSGSENVRLENFEVLYKVAANPNFVTEKAEGLGEYSINLSAITRPAVGFRYQLHLDDSNLAAHAPMCVTPSWKIEPNQASVIISYAFNPAFISPVKRRVTLKNVMVSVTVENTRAKSCQMRPDGAFSRQKNLLYWKMGDITLDADATTPQKLLGRFSTEGEAKPGSIEVRWEISGEEATGLGSGLGVSGMSAVKEEGGSDPFADESAEKATTTAGHWKEVPTTKRIISGKYSAL